MRYLLSDVLIHNGLAYWETVTLSDLPVTRLDLEIDACRQYMSRLMIARYDRIGKHSKFNSLTSSDDTIDN